MKKLLWLMASLVIIFALAGCGSNNDDANPSIQVKKIVAGTINQFPKVAYLDENDKLTGFDVELVREIDKRLPDYEIDIQVPGDLFLSLDTNKVDFIFSQFEKNAEREEKYLFNKEPYLHWKSKVIVAKDDDSIRSLDDLKGKKVITYAATAQAIFWENYNKEHNDEIKIVYTSGAANDTVNQVVTGRVDAMLSADFTLPLIDPQGKLKTVGDPVSVSDILYVFRKDGPESQQLADAIDKALESIKSDGTLSKLSHQWFGQDYTEIR
jgi:L-cystine transport system substrate-binding protein